MTALRPYLLLACVAFTVGFVGYWVLGRVALPAPSAEPNLAPITVPATAPNHWDVPKKI